MPQTDKTKSFGNTGGIVIPADKVARNPQDAGFASDVLTAIQLDTSLGQFGQWLTTSIAADQFDREMQAQDDEYLMDADFNALRDMRDELQHLPMDVISEIYDANSLGDVRRVLTNHELNTERRKEIENSPWARFVGGFLDPINLVPIPIAVGKGLIGGMKAALPVTAGTMVSTEALRHSMDPTSTIEETAFNIGASVLFGEVIAGAAGAYKPGAAGRLKDAGMDRIPKWAGRDMLKRAGNKMDAAFAHMEYVNNFARHNAGEYIPEKVVGAVHMSEAEYNNVISHTLDSRPSYDEWISGAAPDRFSEVPGVYRFQAVEGKKYVIKPMEGDDGTYNLLVYEDGAWSTAGHGSKKDMLNLIDPFEVRPVRSFSTPEAYQISIMTKADLYPDAPNKIEKPEEYEAWKQSKADEVHYDSEGVPVIEETPTEIFSRIGLNLSEELHARKKVVDQLNTDIKKIKADIGELRKKINEAKSKSWKTRWQKDLGKLESELKKTESAQIIAGHRLKETEGNFKDAELSPDPQEWDIRPTLTGLEQAFGSTNQMPWYRLVKTALRTDAPEKAGEWQRIAYDLAGSPGLASYGHGKGLGAGPSVEAMARTWMGKYDKAKTEADRIYFEEYAKIGTKPTPTMVKYLETKQGAKGLMDKWGLGSKDTRLDQLMTISEWRDEIGKAMMTGDKHPVPEVEKAARAYRELAREFEIEGRKYGVFRTQENMQRKIDWNLQKVADDQEFIDALIGRTYTDTPPAERPAVDLNELTEYKGVSIVEGSQRVHPIHGNKSPISVHRNNDGEIDYIAINREAIVESFNNKQWTSPRVKGVTALPDDAFDNVNQWYEFLLEHEMQHKNYPVIKAKQKGYGQNENSINKAAAKELGIYNRLYGKGKSAKKDVAQSQRELELISRRKARIQDRLEENELLESWLEQSRDPDNPAWKGEVGENAWFHRVWNLRAVRDHQDELKNILVDWYKRNPYVYDGIGKKKLSTKAHDIEARAEETIDTIMGEAMYGDTMHVITHGRRDMVVANQSHIEELKRMRQEKLDEGLPEDHHDIKVLDSRVRISESRLEKLLNGKTRGIAAANGLLSRRLDIPNEMLVEHKGINFIDPNVEHVMFQYQQRVAPVIEMAKRFGDFRMQQKLDDLNDSLDEYILGLDPDADAAKIESINAERKDLVQAIEDLRDKVLGIYGIPADPSALSTRTIRLLMAWNTLTAMGRAFLTAINDIGMVTQVNGTRQMFGDLINKFANRNDPTSKWNLAADEVRWAGQALEVQNAIRSRAIMDLPGDAQAFNKLEQWTYDQQGNFFFLNLLSGWTDYAKGFSGSMIQSKMIKNALEWEAGTISKTDMEEMAKAGVTEAMAKKWAVEWRNAGAQRAKDDEGFYLASTQDWLDTATVQEFRAVLGQAIDNTIIQPMAADKPNFMSKDFGKMIMQYHGFSMAATHRIFMSNMQKRDKRALSTVMSMIVLSLMIDQMKRPDYIQMDMEDQLYRAIELSGTLGIITDLNQAMEGATAGEYGFRSLAGLKNQERYADWGSQIGAVGGAVPNQWLGLLATATDENATPDKVARTLRYMVPYNNLWLWNDWVTRTQRTAADFAED